MTVYRVFYDTERQVFDYFHSPIEVNARTFKTKDYEDEADFYSTSDENGIENLIYCLNETCLKYVRVCKECHKGFILTDERKQWYLDRDYHLPCRCMRCMDRRKLKMKG